jgi:SSS family solute:Na+ symporter
MGLRGTTICFPLFGSLLFKKYVTPSAGFLAITLAPLSIIIWKMVYPDSINPVFIGLAISLFILIVGSNISLHKERTKIVLDNKK